MADGPAYVTVGTSATGGGRGVFCVGRCDPEVERGGLPRRESLLNDSGIHSFYTATLLGPLSISNDTTGTCLVILDDMISCVMRLPGLYACLRGNSVLKCGLRVTRQTRCMGVDI